VTVAGPQEVFEKRQRAGHARDYKAVYACLTPQGQAEISGEAAFVMVMVRSATALSLPADQASKKTAKLDELLARHGLGQAYLEDFKANFSEVVGDVGLARKEMRAVGKKIKDGPRFLAELAEMGGSQGTSLGEFSLEQVRVSGDVATGVLVSKQKGQTRRDAVRFVRGRDGWLFDYKGMPNPPANEGKLEGTRWSSDAQTVKGNRLPPGALTLEFTRTGGMTYGVGNAPLTGRYVLGVGEFVRFDLDRELNRSKRHLQRIVVEGNKLKVTDFDGTAMVFTRVR
jgi:hypothetical protein